MLMELTNASQGWTHEILPLGESLIKNVLLFGKHRKKTVQY